jgi:hypothetical protein
MKRKDVLIWGIPYLVINLFLFIIFLLNYDTLNNSLGNHFSYLVDNYEVDGFYLLKIIIYFTYPFGFLFILISGFYIYRLKIKKSIIFGIVGTIIYVLTVFYFTIVYLQNRELQLLLLIFLWVLSSILNIIIFTLLRSEKKELTFEDEMIIKKIVLDLGTKYTRLEVREISEKCGNVSDSIIGVLNSMIMNKEIYAEFFKSSNTVLFDQQANIDEIDELMAAFKDWEDKHYEKQEN